MSVHSTSYDLSPEQTDMVIAMGEWSDQAACRAHPLFLVDGESVREDIRLQKTICLSCPVRDQCLAHAIAFPERGGVWGGMGPKERNNYRLALQRNKI